MRLSRLLFALPCFVLLGSSPARAQDDEAVPVEEVKKGLAAAQAAEEAEGWKITGSLGATFNLGYADQFVGIEDGTSLQLGGLLGFVARLKDGSHRWNNELSFNTQWTRTPQLDRFVKSLDLLELKSTYIYLLQNPPWLGPYVRGALLTSVFPGELVRADDQFQILEQNVDGDQINLRPSRPGRETVHLTDSFEPLQLRLSTGAYGDPIKSLPFNLEFQVGVGAQAVLLHSGGRIFVEETTPDPTPTDPNDNENPIVTVRDLPSSTIDGGVEAELLIFGELVKDRLRWRAIANLFWATFGDTADRFEGDFANQLNQKYNGELSLSLNKWLEAKYTATLLRQPQVLRKLQTQMGLAVVFTYSIL
ncbi:MAG: DUF3078 domain-containing protein [Myxococcales bacterium]|nr:DUF3078 domain-containing protein [Myxococcales bacterium]